ncbi:hypothetical protein H6F42_04190 [Pseudanabaena sp. FACHB-1998]|uniref:hypothetical protein n=1 Tax=Pseudanabaena sp. FACHB-1998 TaxID=2692858 RepID=UPI0016809D13|nr:hypothetical protein [Pseudanabaena sp. FACHB-1998]MBD2176119.1 hypothetical protein [Pseudanabaena sp. FACHB-1998]
MRHRLFLSLSTFLLVSSSISAAVNSQETQTPKQEKYEYPQEVVKTFMKGCGFTNSKDFCTCSLDKLRSQYTFAEFLKIDTAARETKQVPKEVINIFQSCRPKKA